VSVEVWFRDSIDTEVLDGDLLSLCNGLNIAAAQGKQFTIFEDTRGRGVMVETKNIIKAREVEDESAYIGK
jgi:hypothetical protein